MTGQFEHDTPAEREKRIDRMMVHIRHAEYLHAQTRPNAVPTPVSLIWVLLQDAMHTIGQMPNEDLRRVSKIKSLMPDTRVTDREAYDMELSRLLSGMSQYDGTRVRISVRETDIDRMVDVLDLLRFVRGRDAMRLKRTVLARAAGLTIEQCGYVWDRRHMGFDRRNLHDIKTRVIGQILKGLADTFGLVRSGRSFRRHIVRNVEDRKRRKEQQT